MLAENWEYSNAHSAISEKFSAIASNTPVNLVIGAGIRLDES